MSANSVIPPPDLFEDFEWSPELDGSTTTATNNGHQLPVPLDDAFLYGNNLLKTTSGISIRLEDGSQHFSLSAAGLNDTTAFSGGQMVNASPAHNSFATRGQSDRPTSNWFPCESNSMFSDPGSRAAHGIAEQYSVSQFPSSGWSGIGSHAPRPTNATIIGADRLVSDGMHVLPGMAFEDVMSSSWIGSPGQPFGDCFNALDPLQQVPHVEIQAPDNGMSTWRISSKILGQIDVHKFPFHPPQPKRKRIEGGSNGGNKSGSKRKEACRFCQLQKTPCDGKFSKTGQPCKRCFTMTLDRGLAIRFCEYDLKACATRLGMIDFYRLRSRVLKNVPITSDRPTRSIVLTHPLQRIGQTVIHFPGAPTLELACHEYFNDTEVIDEVRVIQYINRHLAEFVVPELARRGTLRPGLETIIELPRFHEPRSSYVFETASLPDREKLVKWGSFDIMMQHSIAPHHVKTAYAAFLAAYVERRGMDAPYARLAKLTVEFACLFRILDGGQPVQREEHLNGLSSFIRNKHGQPYKVQGLMFYDEYRRLRHSESLPLRARRQLFAHVVAFIEPLEKRILEMIDHSIAERAKMRHWKDDPMVLGFVARYLGLHYRARTKHYTMIGKCEVKALRNNQDMFDIMTPHYGYIFKGTLSPFHDEWTAEQHVGILGNDPVLTKILDDVKTAEKFHTLDRLDNNIDNAYKRLVMGHETKRHSTLAKQWNDGQKPLLLAEDLQSLQKQHDFQLWSLKYDTRGRNSSALVDMEGEPSDSDGRIDRPLESHRVESRRVGVRSSLQVTPRPAPLESKEKQPLALDYNTRPSAPHARATLESVSPFYQTWQVRVGQIAFTVLPYTGECDRVSSTRHR